MTDNLPTKDDVVGVLTGQHRTVAAERDLPRVRAWIDDAVRHAVNEAAQALNAIRYWCDQTEAWIAMCPHGNTDIDDCDACYALNTAVGQVRSLLPALETSERRADTGEEVTSDARDASDAGRRPGLVSPGGSETGGGYRSP
jgi:hypothetical protein